MTVHELLTALSGIKDIVLGMAGGIAAYLFDYSKAKREGDADFRFLVSSMLINMALGAFVAYIIGSVISEDVTYRNAIIALSGVTAFQIILLAESRFAEWVIARLTSSTSKNYRDTNSRKMDNETYKQCKKGESDDVG